MTQGNLYKQIIIYALPLIATNILQLLFNAADVAVLSIFAQDGDLAIAAVGSTGAIVNLVIGLFVGLSVGANVLIARCVGMQDRESAKRTVGMSVVLSVLVGIFLAVIGTIMARRFLEWTHVDAAALDKATVYLTIYFLGMPIMMLYNFAASILRAVGDTFRPLIFLVIGGVANVILNIFFVLVVGWDVEGVAIATVVSQAVSATLCIVTIAREKGYCKLEFKYMRFLQTRTCRYDKNRCSGRLARLRFFDFQRNNSIYHKHFRIGSNVGEYDNQPNGRLYLQRYIFGFIVGSCFRQPKLRRR